MKERPILYSGSMVRAILDGRKTQTRRIATGVVEIPGPYSVEAWERGEMPRCHYGSPGDRMWVRETWRYHDWTEEGEPWIRYAADDTTAGPLAVSDEGQPGAWWTADPSAGAALHARDPVAAFRKLWDSINGDRASWESNPWVWVVEFKRAEVRK